MSYLTFNSVSSSSKNIPAFTGTLRSAFSRWLLANHGSAYLKEIKRQHALPNAKHFNQILIGFILQTRQLTFPATR